jgi:L-rhamnose-H+ transport protein
METSLGLLAVILAGMMQGVFALPLKFTQRWNWENTWLVYATTGMLVLPWIAVGLFTRDAADIYAHSSVRALSAAAAFGMGWGFGSVLCGLGIVALGIALGSSIILGLASALGSLLPLLLLHPERVGSRSGVLTILGVAVMLGGIAVCAAAGRARESAAERRGSFSGVLICVASGVLSAFINFAFAFGDEIAKRAEQAGHSRVASVYPLLAVILSAGFLPNAGYSVLLLVRNRSWKRFAAVGSTAYWPLGVSMGILVFGGLLLYGFGSAMLGLLGTSAGWALSMSAMIVAANCSGFLTGEWRGATGIARRRMVAGVLVLLAAIVILGIANA